MKRYEFSVVLAGEGETADEAWEDAVEHFEGDCTPEPCLVEEI